MQLVRAGFGDHVHHRAGIAPVFGVESIGEHAKLLDAVRRRLDRRQVGKLIVSVAAVHREIVVAAAAAVHGDNASSIAPINRSSTPNCDCTPGCNCSN